MQTNPNKQTQYKIGNKKKQQTNQANETNIINIRKQQEDK